jgi:hypothetical protein
MPSLPPHLLPLLHRRHCLRLVLLVLLTSSSKVSMQLGHLLLHALGQRRQLSLQRLGLLLPPLRLSRRLLLLLLLVLLLTGCLGLHPLLDGCCCCYCCCC